MISKWLIFKQTGTSESGKTLIWRVAAKSTSNQLGEVRWSSSWRKYAFFPSTATMFEDEMLQDIAFFCTQATRKHMLNLE